MILKMFAIFDSAIGAYERPMCFLSKGEAVRAWQQVVNDKEMKFIQSPADFTLFEIGEYDADAGRVSSLKAHVPIGTALEFLRPSGPAGVNPPVVEM